MTNISGMSFDRRGLDKLTAAVDADMIDAVIVKDLSRLAAIGPRPHCSLTTCGNTRCE